MQLKSFLTQLNFYCILLSFSFIFLRRLSLIFRYYLSQFEVVNQSVYCKWDRFYIINQVQIIQGRVNSITQKAIIQSINIVTPIISIDFGDQLKDQTVYNLNFKKEKQGMKVNYNSTVKMIDFIENLYKQYKVLNKISEKESLQFQREIVTQLVDSKQNVDNETLKQILKETNIQGMILDTLCKVINRNPFKNQFQLNRNLATITQNVKKQQEELQRKQKILQRKQEKIKNTEDSIMANIKQKLQIMENQALQKLNKKESQIKKNVTALINQLKSKEKIIMERYEAIKSNNQVLAQIELKEKSINQKLKLIEKKEREIRTKDNEAQIIKKDNQMNILKETIQKLRQSLKESNKRYKNLQMAYKKLKNTKVQQETSQKKKQQLPKLQIDSNGHQLDKLQLSQIYQNEKNNNCDQLINYIDLQEVNTKIEEIKRVFVVKDQSSSTKKLKQIKQLLNIQASIPQKSQPSSSYSDEEQDSSLEKQEQMMPPCLQPIQQPAPNNANSLIKKIEAIPLEKDADKLAFVQQNKMQGLISQSYQLNTPQKVCEVLLQRLLQLIQQSPHYMQIIQYLSSPDITNYLQHIYLSHETNPDIIQTATLILSRIKLKDYQLKLNNSFVKALQIRLKVENKSSFLYGNIHFILN